ncbi:MAG TPA: hypothetical protein IAB21_04135 [Candidatus Avelusimicrobium excrementipullorum]|nr:hypothetical protein [Candidatus Avelusimicrobium excrementipullorum]
MSSKFYGNFSFYDIALRPKKDKVSLITNQQEIQEDIGCIPEKEFKNKYSCHSRGILRI